MKRKIILTICALFLTFSLSLNCFAHQPRLVKDSFINVKNPEISQAFYGELTGQPHTYEFESEEEFKLYLGILVPYLPDIDKDVSAQVFHLTPQEKKTLFYLKDNKAEWEIYFDKFAGDHYFIGPELKNEAYIGDPPQGIVMDPGTYQVKVYSPDNEGKYVLVIGELEKFPLHEIFKSVIALPKIKSEFFEKPAYTAYFNYVGLIIFGFIIIITVLIIYLVWLIRKLKQKHDKKSTKKRKKNK
ncbi:hypothetical protein ACFL21_00930 [Patescibacteria group bacterium]